MKKYLGIDWGEKRIGLALAEEGLNMSWPLKVANNIKEILETIEEEGVDKIIIGKPLKMKGENKELDPRFNKFISQLEKEANIPIELIDERLSSLEADKLIGRKKDKAPRDALAAMIILQTYLDKHQ